MERERERKRERERERERKKEKERVKRRDMGVRKRYLSSNIFFSFAEHLL